MTGTAGAQTAVAPPKAYNDQRFHKIHNQAQELKGLLRELGDMVDHKLDELLGPIPRETSNDIAEKQREPDNWIDSVLFEQDVSISTCNDIIARIQTV